MMTLEEKYEFWGRCFLDNFYEVHDVYKKSADRKIKVLNEYFNNNQEYCTDAKDDEQELAILEIDILTRFGFYPDTITV